LGVERRKMIKNEKAEKRRRALKSIGYNEAVIECACKQAVKEAKNLEELKSKLVKIAEQVVE
jgi:hypothetical protein